MFAGLSPNLSAPIPQGVSGVCSLSSRLACFLTMSHPIRSEADITTASVAVFLPVATQKTAPEAAPEEPQPAGAG